MWQYRAKVARVVDGDTVDLVLDAGFRIQTQQRVRMARINAPERSDLEAWQRAKDALTQALDGPLWVQTLKTNTLSWGPIDEADSFDRFLTWAFQTEEDMKRFRYSSSVNAWLVTAGFAVRYMLPRLGWPIDGVPDTI